MAPRHLERPDWAPHLAPLLVELASAETSACHRVTQQAGRKSQDAAVVHTEAQPAVGRP